MKAHLKSVYIFAHFSGNNSRALVKAINLNFCAKVPAVKAWNSIILSSITIASLFLCCLLSMKLFPLVYSSHLGSDNGKSDRCDWLKLIESRISRQLRAWTMLDSVTRIQAVGINVVVVCRATLEFSGKNGLILAYSSSSHLVPSFLFQ